MSTHLGRLLAIAGPTAVGKSAVAVALAQRLQGEIISADSVQVYRGLDIGSAKPTPAERQGVSHHLIDICDPDERYSVARFQADCDAAVAAVRRRGHLPILVGGTGLYMRAALRAYAFTREEHDPALRAALQAEAQAEGTAALHARLARHDPAAAQKIHPNDERRILRALEVLAQTGRPISESQVQHQAPPRYDYLLVALTRERAALYADIEARVEAMLDAGWEDEVRGLLARFPPDAPGLAALGYAELIAYLQGRLPRAEAVGLIKRNTRRFAKRQLTWLRAEPRIRWVEAGKASGREGVVEETVKVVAGEWIGP